MELVAILYWVIGVLSISLVTALLLSWKDVGTKTTQPDGMSDSQAATEIKAIMKESDEKLLYDMYYHGAIGGYLPSILVRHAEMKRRLTVELRKFNHTTTWLTLALVQIVLTIKHW